MSRGVGTEGGAHLDPRRGRRTHIWLRMVRGWEQRAAPLGPAGPGTSGSRRRLKGEDAQLSTGFFFGWWWVPQRKERRLGKGRVLTPRRRLSSSSEPRVGAGRGWGRGKGNRWAARAPGSCGGRGSVGGGGAGGGRGKRGRGRADPTPTPEHARRARTLRSPPVLGSPARRRKWGGRVGCGGRRCLAWEARGGIFRGGESGMKWGWGREHPTPFSSLL